MLACPDIYTDEDIIDEVADFLAAGTKTSVNATQTALFNLMIKPELLNRLREEFESTIGSKDSYEAAIKEGLTYDKIRDMSFISHVFSETLRIGNTAPGSSP